MDHSELAAVFGDAFGPGVLERHLTHAWWTYRIDDGRIVGVSDQTLHRAMHMDGHPQTDAELRLSDAFARQKARD